MSSSSSPQISTLEKRDAFLDSSSKKHDVFVSFRGEDTRNNITSHLIASLRRYGIDTFYDEITLERGDEIKQALLEGIRKSIISIIVFSKNYASSSWCLDELQCIHECNKAPNENKQIVIPIFHHVDPSDVRNQRGTYRDAFDKHEKKYIDKKDVVTRWKDALKEFGGLAGFVSDGKRPESELVEEIARDVLNKLNRNSSSEHFEGLIGIEEHIQKIKLLLSSGSSKVHIVGLWGMGGLGKTTIAEVVFYRLYHQFEDRCFLPNVREESGKLGLINLRNKLLNDLFKGENINLGTSSLPNSIKDRLSRKKVLIVLDDVNDSEQLEYLINDTGDCFGQESIIIITTRDAQVLKGREVAVYEVRELDDDKALQLFKLKAFKGKSLSKDYIELSDEVVRLYAGGNPLALKILGSHLNGLSHEDPSDWKTILQLWEKKCCPKMVKILEISFAGLDKNEKAIFLDIACFFKGERKDFVENILEGCGFEAAAIQIKCLIDKSLITISDNIIRMHDLVQEMGWNIVQQSENLGERSRLWIAKQVCQVLDNNEGTDKIEGIFLNLSQIDGDLHLTPEVFQNMRKLRLLKIFYNPWDWDGKSKVYLSQDLQSLPDRLSYLDWERCPLKRFPSKFKPRNLSELRMPHSEIEQLWDRDQDLNKLKSIDLSHSIHLTKIPDLSHAPNLEKINLRYCTNLCQFPWHSLQKLGKLDDLNLEYCEKLSSPAVRIDGRTLRSLNLRGCSNFLTLPMMLTTSLSSLNLSSTPIKHLPSSIDSLKSLSKLNLSGCKSLTNIPSSMQKLDSLKHVYLSGCSSLHTFPKLPRNIKYICLSETAIKEVHPSSFEECSSLEQIKMTHCERLESLQTNSLYKLESLFSLDLSGCSSLDTFPKLPRNIREISLCETAIRDVHPSSFEDCFSLQSIKMVNCKRLESLQTNSLSKLESLFCLDLSGCSSLDTFPKLPRNIGLIRLCKTAIREVHPSSFEDCLRLQSIKMTRCESLESLPSWIFKLKSLLDIDVSHCTNLKNLVEISEDVESSYSFKAEIPKTYRDFRISMRSTGIRQIPSWMENSRVNHLETSGCKNLEFVADNICNMKRLRILVLSYLPPTIGNFLSLVQLELRNSNISEIPPDIKRLSDLQTLKIMYCEKIEFLPELPLSLEHLEATSCSSLVSTPNRALAQGFWDGTIIRWNCDITMFRDCLKLDENARYNIIKDFQFRALRAASVNARLNLPCYPLVETCCPCPAGNEILEWFTYLGEGSSVDFELPPQWHNSNFLGFAVFAVATMDSRFDDVKLCYEFDLKRNNDGSFKRDFYGDSVDAVEAIATVDSDQLFMLYCHQAYSDSVDAVEANFSFFFRECSTDFEEGVESSTKIKRCGVRILYLQEFQSAAITDLPEHSSKT